MYLMCGVRTERALSQALAIAYRYNYKLAPNLILRGHRTAIFAFAAPNGKASRIGVGARVAF